MQLASRRTLKQVTLGAVTTSSGRLFQSVTTLSDKENLIFERKHWALRPQKPSRLIRDGEVGGSGILYLTPTRYTVTTRMILH